MHESRAAPFPWRPAPLLALALHVLAVFLVVTVELPLRDAADGESPPIQVSLVQLPESVEQRETREPIARPVQPPPPNLAGGEIAELSSRPRGLANAPEPMPEIAEPPPAPREADRPEPAAQERVEPAPAQQPADEPLPQVAMANQEPTEAQQRGPAPSSPANEEPTPPAQAGASAEPPPATAVQIDVGPTAAQEVARAFAVPRPPSTRFSAQPDTPRPIVVRPPPTPRPAPPAVRTNANGDVDLFGGRALQPRQVASAPPRTSNAVRLPRGVLAGADRPTQTLADLVLQQTVTQWRFNYRDPRFAGIEFSGYVLLNADGSLTTPFNKSDPLNFYAMIQDYQGLSQRGASPEIRRAMETFVIALRAAQPFRLPAGVDGYPRRVPIGFLLGEL
jgi:hypothetical protein